jgi:hypothetical protein
MYHNCATLGNIGATYLMSLMSTTNNPVSFTVRRPTPNTDSDNEGFKIPQHPRHSLKRTESGKSSPLSLPPTRPPKRTTTTRGNDSDEDEGTEDEIITGFDRFGVTRCVFSAHFDKRSDSFTKDSSRSKAPRKKEGPLIIPAVKNKDWRAVARARNAPSFVPNGGAQATGADGSVGGLGTRDQINSGPQTAGLTFRKRAKLALEGEDDNDSQSKPDSGVDSEPTEEPTEDQKALKALLSSADGEGNGEEEIAAIPLPKSGLSTPGSLAEREKAAYHRDVQELPDSASLDAYDRIPVSQFGAALLRGMGWKEGQAASRTRKGPVEPWIPTQRPQLLGIGAKEREVLDDGSGKKKGKSRQELKKYMPLVKVDKVSKSSCYSSTETHSSVWQGSSSRDRSPDERKRRDDDRRSHSEHRNSREREREPNSRRDRDDRDKEREHDRDRRRDDRDKDYDSRDRRRDRKEDRDRHRSHRSSRYDDRDGSKTNGRGERRGERR